MDDAELIFPMDDAKDDDVLLKHVNAIALMPVIGGRRISLLGRRLFNVLLHHSMACPEKEEHEAGLTEIVDMADFTSRNFDQIKKTLKELMSTTVEWQSPAKNEAVETWDACNLLSGVGLTKNKKSGHVTVRWRFDSKVRENILKPEIYSRLSLESIMMFSTHGAMALYEICARYAKNPSHLTTRRNWREWWLPVLTGVSKDKSKTEYRFFKRDVLKKAVAEVNAKSNLVVIGPIEFKAGDGKTVNDIQFEVYYKKESETETRRAPLINTTEEELPIIGRAINLGVKQKDIEQLFAEYSLKLVVIGLDKLEQRLAMPKDKVSEISRPGLWLKAVIKKLSKEEEAGTLGASEPIDIDKRREEWAQEWLRTKKESLLNTFEDSPESVRQGITDAFIEHLEDFSRQTMLVKLKKILKDNDSQNPKINFWEHRMLRSVFINFLGLTYRGDDWDKPTAEDLLIIAAKERR